MHRIDVQKTGLAVGFFLGVFHAFWALIIASGWGQAIYDFILWAHMIHLPIVIGPFDFTAAATLIIVTFVIGYVFGLVFAYLWNWLHRNG